MSQHPVTPMLESDLRVHLGRQTSQPVSLLDCRDVHRWAVSSRSGDTPWQTPGLTLCDHSRVEEQPAIGALVDLLAVSGPVFSIGSSGLMAALGAHWRAGGVMQPRGDWPALRANGPVLVVSGSCSPVTARQIHAALAAGWAGVDAFSAAAVQETTAHLRTGRSVILHTSIGPDDPRRALTDAGLGTTLGQMTRAIFAATETRRIIFAGGDTSSHAVAELGVRSLEMICPVTPGAPLCRGSGFQPEVEIICKGGQAGPDDFFLRAAGASLSGLTSDE